MVLKYIFLLFLLFIIGNHGVTAAGPSRLLQSYVLCGYQLCPIGFYCGPKRVCIPKP